MKKNHWPLIVGNWKMHKTVKETKEHILRLKPLVFRSHVGIWLAVPYTDLQPASELAKGSAIRIGAQNMSDLMGGALTGEIAAPMIVEAGASFVILGHSERRRLFGEDDFMINRKVKLALRAKLRVILCIGETKEEREAGKTASVLQLQLEECLEGVLSEDIGSLIIAYEPVWAIGSKQPATVEMVEEIHQLCKTLVANFLKTHVDHVHILYGGSVTPANAPQFLMTRNVDGLLVGGASLDVNAFAEMIHAGDRLASIKLI